MDIETIFREKGGEFITPFSLLDKKIAQIRAWVLDWDGVFNNGIKSTEHGSPFSEADAMGTNLFRLSYWLKYQTYPIISIITGENNPTAVKLAQREHFHAVYKGFKDKRQAMEHLCLQHQIEPVQIAFGFDDVLDLSMAAAVGMRFMARRDSSPLTTNYAIEKQCVDYITAHSGGQHAVREIAELLMGLLNNFGQTLDVRTRYDNDYRKYITGRNKIPTQIYGLQDTDIVSLSAQSQP